MTQLRRSQLGATSACAVKEAERGSTRKGTFFLRAECVMRVLHCPLLTREGARPIRLMPGPVSILSESDRDRSPRARLIQPHGNFCSVTERGSDCGFSRWRERPTTCSVAASARSSTTPLGSFSDRRRPLHRGAARRVGARIFRDRFRRGADCVDGYHDREGVRILRIEPSSPLPQRTAA